jgi:DNA (cytosine-5)-methyltransferase 1
MLKTLDLFAGAGGLSLGFVQTNQFCIVAAAENEKDIQETYQKNHVNVKMISNVVGFDFVALKKEFDGIDIVIGGPPCQGFSNANRQKKGLVSENNALVKEFFRAIKEIKPKAFVMENVSMLTSETHRFYERNDEHTELASLNVNYRDDKILLSEKEIMGFDFLPLIKNKQLLYESLLPKKLSKIIENMAKKVDNQEKLLKYISKNRTSFLKLSEKYISTTAQNCYTLFISEKLKMIQEDITNSFSDISKRGHLTDLVVIIKALRIACEIYKNNILCIFEHDELSQATIAKMRSYSVIDYIQAILGNEYKQKGEIINARWFGVPQERKRYILMGIRSDLIGDAEIRLPQKPNDMPVVTVSDAISDLQNCEVSANKDAPAIDYHNSCDSLSEYASSLRYEGLLYNHITTDSKPNAIKRFKALKEGENFHSLPKALIASYEKPERTQNTIYLRLNSSEPAGTVVNVRKSMWIHPKLNRAITVREAARLQSFPDEFIFLGSKDSQFQQVGNAVPPRMAKAIAESLLESLNGSSSFNTCI